MKKELALGMMRLPVGTDKEIDYARIDLLVDYFLEQGFRKFDTAEMYHDTQSEAAVRECIVKRHSRESFEIADKLSSWRIPEGSGAEQFFSRQLQVTGLEYFDRYLLHSMEEHLYPEAVEKRYFDFIFEKKAKGMIREAGFSFHGQPELLEKILTEYPEVDFVQLQINYIDWDNPAVRSRQCYEIARKYGKKILIMEPVKGGLLAELPEDAVRILKETSPDRSVASWAIRFAAGLDGVDTVLSGMSTMEQMQDNTALMKDFQALSDEELKTLGRLRAFLHQNPHHRRSERFCHRDRSDPQPSGTAAGIVAGIPQPEGIKATKNGTTETAEFFRFCGLFLYIFPHKTTNLTPHSKKN